LLGGLLLRICTVGRLGRLLLLLLLLFLLLRWLGRRLCRRNLARLRRSQLWLLQLDAGLVAWRVRRRAVLDLDK
jgi:hypothetical protein